MNQNEREIDRLRGRLEAVLITVGNHAGHLGSLLGPSIDGEKPPIEKLEHLAAIIRDNPAFSEIRHIADEGARLIRLYNAQPEAPEVVVREMLDGAAAVMVSLDRIRNTLLANAAANQRLAEMQAQTGGEPRLTTEQQITLSGHEIEKQKIIAESSNNLLQATITFAGATIKGLLLINGGAAIAILAFIGTLNNENDIFLAMNLAYSLSYFGIGAATAVIVAMSSYIAQSLFHERYINETRFNFWTSEIFRAISIIFALVSISLFSYGLYSSADAFLGQIS